MLVRIKVFHLCGLWESSGQSCAADCTGGQTGALEKLVYNYVDVIMRH